MKKYLFIIILILACKNLFSQKRFDLTIVLNDSIDSRNITCQYYNGLTDIFVKDTFENNTLILKDKFFSDFISVHIEYRVSNSVYYTNDFFINEKPAKITFHFKHSDHENILKYHTIINATPIYDTSANKIFKQLVRYRRKEAETVSDFWQRNGNEIQTNDSLIRLNRNLFKSLNNRTILFLKTYSQNYFSFWYYRTQVVETSVTFLNKDVSYLKSLIAQMKSIYPKRYIESAEGVAMIKRIRQLTNPVEPPKVNSPAPLFKIKDISGNYIRLSDYKGKYVLLDFWASWCPPCMREIPFIKQLRNEYPPDKLIIIGISDDRDLADAKQAIIKHELNWINILDEKKIVSNLFGVYAIPVKVLVDKEGAIVYDSREKDDKDQLEALLKNMK